MPPAQKKGLTYNLEEKMEKFMIDEKGLLWVLVEGSEGYACTGLQCEEGDEEKVWDAIPDGTVFIYPE